MTSPRIVVTGAKDGKSVVVSDGSATTIDIPLMPGSAYVPVWGADETPVVPDSAQAVQPRTYFPPAGGFRFCFFTLGPATAALPADFDPAAAAAQVQQDIPGLLDVFERRPGPERHPARLAEQVRPALRAGRRRHRRPPRLKIGGAGAGLRRPGPAGDVRRPRRRTRRLRVLAGGRFQEASRVSRHLLEQIIAGQDRLAGLPVLGNVDFDHTNPLATFPIGGRASLTVGTTSSLRIADA
ncbi:MAG: hypothetical protein ABSB59_33205 [Streptosporangiaceae bacterium]|jgi:hypothetical protein